jgi:hypothetical protein
MLLHLTRGHRGDRALASIPTVRRMASGVRLVRPFLFGPWAPDREALARWRAGRGVPHREDATNADEGIPRNAWRARLAAGRPPLDAPTLEAVRAAAQRRLQARVARVAARFEAGLRPEGLGSFLGHEALRCPADDTPEAWWPEVLRLLGAALAAPRHLAPRRSGVASLVQLLERNRRASLELPADPTPVQLAVSPAGLHLPHEALSHRADPVARVLTALEHGGLHLGPGCSS